MTLELGMWAVLGIATGALHAFSMWRAVQPPFRWAAAGPLRLLGVAGMFVVAGIFGGLVPIVAGWIGGFPVTIAILYFRGPT